MKTLPSAVLISLLTALATNALHAEDAKFDDKGITFTYPKEWKVKTESKVKDVTTITADNGKGSLVTLTLNLPSVEPKQLSGELDKIKKIFEDRIVPGSDMPVKRKLFGAEREGQTLEIEVSKGANSKMEHYAFQLPSKKHTIAVRLQTTSIDPDAKKAVDALLESLAEKK